MNNPPDIARAGGKLRRLARHCVALAALPLLAAADRPEDTTERVPERAAMVAEVIAHARAIGAEGEIGPAVFDALRAVPRHLFVPPEMRPHAYANRPLPIGHDQTISQPLIVALMTGLLRVGPDARVLEIGTGSGYQAAILSRLVHKVYTIEIVEPLATATAAQLRAEGYANITVRHGDGYRGWPEEAPFDAIMVTAGAPHVPQPLVEQLKPGGRMVIPVGTAESGQKLLVIEKDKDGRLREQDFGPVLFVPLTGIGRK